MDEEGSTGFRVTPDGFLVTGGHSLSMPQATGLDPGESRVRQADIVVACLSTMQLAAFMSEAVIAVCV